METAAKPFDNKREAELALCKIRDDKVKGVLTNFFLPEENLERLERGNLRFGGRISSISCRCRCHHSR